MLFISYDLCFLRPNPNPRPSARTRNRTAPRIINRKVLRLRPKYLLCAGRRLPTEVLIPILPGHVFTVILLLWSWVEEKEPLTKEVCLLGIAGGWRAFPVRDLVNLHSSFIDFPGDLEKEVSFLQIVTSRNSTGRYVEDGETRYLNRIGSRQYHTAFPHKVGLKRAPASCTWRFLSNAPSVRRSCYVRALVFLAQAPFSTI